MFENIKNKVLNGGNITKEEALSLLDVELNALLSAANEIREHFLGNKFDVCSIINAKCGKCSENCKYCAQSSFYDTKIEGYPLLSREKIVAEAKRCEKMGVLRFSIVTSGRKPTKTELLEIAESIKEIKKNCKIEVCASLGLLDFDELKLLKNAGLSRFHNNLESSEKYFKSVCTTHTTKDKIETLKSAIKVGLEVCSGGIFNLGETFTDRIDMGFLLREVGVKSIPINILSPIKGTPYEKNPQLEYDEILRICAIYRFINPKAFLRLAGGRNALSDNGEKCLKSGINAVITGDMLTTSGITILKDFETIEKLGFEVKL